ncbi:MAG TPA: ATP-binding protein [Usitatibacter sp.]|nr:ATP-binding protein [Usitatibacter sp.]
MSLLRDSLRRFLGVATPKANPLGQLGYWMAAVAIVAMGGALFVAMGNLRDAAGTQEAAIAYRRALFVLVAAVLLVIAVMIPGYVGFVREARARLRAERLITRLANAVPGALVKFRVFPDGTRRYEFLSEGVKRLRGIDREAALRDPNVVLGTILPGDRDGLLAALDEGGRTLSPIQHDYRVRGEGGEIRWIRTSAAPDRGRDGSIVWSAYWADVTAEKTAERELRESKEAADAASRAKSTFLATMSHEIRTPMNGVLGMLELLALSDLNAEQRNTLEVVRESGRSLQRIIDDILDFSKIEAGKLELRPEPASVADIVERVHNIYAGNASSKGLLLRRWVDPDISPAVVVDPLRLQQVLNNLASNAIKFTSEGEVEIRAELADRLGTEDIVRFIVCDSGMGISPEDQRRLFAPFSQAVEASQYHGGTGLGLSICQRLAQLMGGLISMKSEPGRGTTVTLTLPLPVAQAAPGRASKRPANVPLPRRRQAPSTDVAAEEGTLLLVVDDHPTNRTVLVKQVNALGYAAESAANGVDAVDLWSTGRIAAIVTDCNMPEMNGYELARHVRACESRNGHARTPIIACTANALGGEADKCLAAGMDDYLAKPIELAQLAQKLEKWVPLPASALAAERPSRPQLSLVPEPEPIDRKVLAHVSGGDARAEREILTRFREFNSEDVIHLTNAAEKWDLRLLQQAAHRIKGAARTIGAMALGHACERLERAGRDRDLAAARAAMPTVVAEVERLDAWLGSLERTAPRPVAVPRVKGAVA